MIVQKMTKKILLKIAKKNKKVKVYFCLKIMDSHAMNLGLKFSKGQLHFFTDSSEKKTT